MGTGSAGKAKQRYRRKRYARDASALPESGRLSIYLSHAAAGCHRAAAIAFLALSLAGAASGSGLLGDITMNRISTANGVPAVVFPHWKHRSRFRCYACHPAVFEMQAGSTEINMEALRGGEFCGRCHDGKTAWAIGFDTCRECHSTGEM